MKKIIKFLLTSCITMCLFTSCLSTSLGSSNEIITSKGFNTDYDGEDLIVSIKPICQNFIGLHIKGFSVNVLNNTDSKAYVDFEMSSVYVLGDPTIPFVSGMKYMNAGDIPARKNLLKGMPIIFDMYSSSQVSYNNGWDIDFLPDIPITVVLSIVIDDKTYTWTETFEVKEKVTSNDL